MTTSEKSKISPSEFFVQFSIIIIGLAVGSAVQELFKNENEPISRAVIARFLTIIVVLIVWLHSQIGLANSELYKFKTNWLLRVLEYFLELANLIVPMIAAIKLRSENEFYTWIVLAYGSNALLNGFTLIRLSLAGHKKWKEKRTLEIWVITNLITISMCGIVFVTHSQYKFTDNVVSLSFLGIVLVMTLLDYYLNKGFYFPE